MPVRIDLPYNWAPRDYQMPAWLALEGGCRRLLLIWHRRAGKDLFALNALVLKAMERVGAYWHIFPTYAQGRKIVWEGKTKDGRPFLDHIPQRIISRIRDQEMTIDFVNGSSYRVVGADNPDSQVGTNPVGMIFSEWAVLRDDSILRYLEPILIENGGWAMFITTPRGRNHCFRMMKRVEKMVEWFVQILTVDDTGAVDLAEIDAARKSGAMNEDLIQQEFYCSFDASLEAAYFRSEMRTALEQGRITRVPYDPHLRVSTAWDLGMSDQMAIWFFQMSIGQTRFIDYTFGSGHGLEEYATRIDKRMTDWKAVPGVHLLPHDAKVRELGTGRQREMVLRKLLHGSIRVVPRSGFQDGIQASRRLLAVSYFDEELCATGIEGLRQFVKQPIEGAEDPDGNPIFSNEPVRNWAKHPADAYRTAAMGARPDAPPGQPEVIFTPVSIV